MHNSIALCPARQQKCFRNSLETPVRISSSPYDIQTGYLPKNRKFTALSLPPVTRNWCYFKGKSKSVPVCERPPTPLPPRENLV